MRRERVNNREGEGKRQTVNEGGWSVVSRRRRTAGSERRSGYDGHVHVHTNGVPWRDRRSSTVFIDNIPEFYDRFLLKKLFIGMGRVLDAHVPWRKREKKNTCFGFVIFERKEEAEGALRKMNGITVFGHKLAMEMTFNGGQGRKLRKEGEETNENQGRQRFTRVGVTYAQAVGNMKHRWVEKNKKVWPSQEENGVESSCKGVEGKWDDFMKIQKEQGKMLADIEMVCLTLKRNLKFLMEKFKEICEEDEVMEEDGKEADEDKGEEEGFNGSRLVEEEFSSVPESVGEGLGQDKPLDPLGTKSTKQGSGQVADVEISGEGKTNAIDSDDGNSQVEEDGSFEKDDDKEEGEANFSIETNNHLNFKPKEKVCKKKRQEKE